MKLSWTVALVWLGALTVTAQGSQVELTNQTPGAIQGVVATPDSHMIANARVRITQPQGDVEQTTVSDASGRFSLSGLSPGMYEITVEIDGFERLTRTVEVTPGGITSLSLRLALIPFTETITVTGTRTEQKLGEVPIQVSVLTRDDINRSAALTLDDLLKQIPSFSLFRRTSSLVSHPTTQGVSLRGIGASGVSRTLVMLDGVPHNDQFGNWVYWSKIPSAQIETIEFADGGLSNLYGSSAMAGVINIVTRRPERRTLAFKTQGGLRETGGLDFFGSHEWGPVAAAVGGRVFRTGGYHLVRQAERGPVDTQAASRHETFNWRLEYSPAPNVTLFHHGRVFDEQRDNGTPRQENSTRETYLGAGLRAHTSDESDWQANFFSHIQTFKSSFSAIAADRATETLTLLQHVPSTDIGVNAQWARRFASAHSITLGTDVRWINARNKEDVFIPPEVNVRDRLITGEQLYAGVFFQDFMTPMSRLVFVFGARVDHWRNFDASQTEIVNATQTTTLTPFRDTSETTVTPRAGITFHLTDGFSLRGAFYQGFRAPTLNELYRPFRVGNVQTNANDHLGPERLTGGEVGFNYAITGKLFWRATGFWNRLKDSISNVTISVTPTLITRQRQNLGRARVRGIQSDIEYRINPRWKIAGHYLFDEAAIEEFSAEPAIEGNLIPQVPKHRVSVGLDYANPAWFHLSLQGRFESFRFDDDLNQFKLDSLVVADFTLSRALGKLWEVFFSAENLFNRRYAVQATPVELLGTPIIVSVGVRFNLSRQ